MAALELALEARGRLPHAARFLRRHPADAALAVVLAALAAFLAAPAALADERGEDPRLVALRVAAMQNELASHGRLPEASRRWTIRIPITAYSSDPWQTDDTPLITASQTYVRDGIVAANEDRMNARYHYKMDIWMPDRDSARRFGLKYAEVEVLPD
jgi:hypothetical protein